MWFKNLTFFRLAQPLEQTSEELDAALRRFAWEPAASMAMERTGWVPPIGDPEAPMVHTVGRFHLLCLHEQSKILPASVIRDALNEKVEDIEQREGRTVRRREKDRLRDEVTLDLLPQAFSRHRRTWGYIDAETGFIAVDTASASAAERFVEALREALGSLPVVLPETVRSPQAVMTEWLLEDDPPQDVELGDQAMLEDPRQEGCEVRLKHHDLLNEEIRTHLYAGKRVRSLAFTWNQRLSAVVGADFSIRRLKFLDLVQEEAGDTDAETPAERMDVDFTLMALELQRFYPQLMELFGGERTQAGLDPSKMAH